MNQIPVGVWISIILISYSAIVLYLVLAAQAWKNKTLDLTYLILEADHYCATCIEAYEIFTTAEEHQPPPPDQPTGLPYNDGIQRWFSDHEYLPCFLIVVPAEVAETGRTVTSEHLDESVLVPKEVTRRQHDVR